MKLLLNEDTLNGEFKMNKKIGIFALLSILCTMSIYADDLPGVNTGAEQYDWQTCINAKTSSCLNACSASEDTDCSENCKSLARDKCLSEGITEPQELSN
jgi:hypothetical protein